MHVDHVRSVTSMEYKTCMGSGWKRSILCQLLTKVEEGFSVIDLTALD